MHRRISEFATFFFLILWFSNPYLTSQKLGKDILGDGFQYDAHRTELSSRAAKLMFAVMFGEMPGFEVETELYRFDGDFDRALKSIRVPSNADVEPDQKQSAAAGLGMFKAMLEEQIRQTFGAAWLRKADGKIDEWGKRQIRSFRFTAGRDRLMNPENLNPGETVSFLTVDCSRPLVDLSNLEIVDGTWITISRVSLKVPDMGAEREFAGLLGDEEEESGPTMDPGIEMMPGVVFIDAEETSYDLAGEMNWLVEKPIKSVVDFYMARTKRHCSIDSESTMPVDNVEVPYYTLYCLTHQGELKAGDDVIAIDITKPARGLLSEAMGRNQGTWTIISINRWVEEDY